MKKGSKLDKIILVGTDPTGLHFEEEHDSFYVFIKGENPQEAPDLWLGVASFKGLIWEVQALIMKMAEDAQNRLPEYISERVKRN